MPSFPSAGREREDRNRVNGMEKEIFADAIGNIAYENGVLRIDLVGIAPGQRAQDGGPMMGLRQRIVMPVPGFVKSLAVIEEMVSKLVSSGLIQKRTRAEETKTAAPAEGATNAE